MDGSPSTLARYGGHTSRRSPQRVGSAPVMHDLWTVRAMTSDALRSAAQPDPGPPRAKAQGTPARRSALELQGSIEQRIDGCSCARDERRSNPWTPQSVALARTTVDCLDRGQIGFQE